MADTIDWKKFDADYRAAFASTGGKARAAKLTAKRRKEIAQKAAKVRWSRNGGKPK